MTYKESTVKDLINILPQKGRVCWIGVRSKHKGKVIKVDKVSADISKGIIGDHYQNKSRKRQVTLIQEEHIQVVSNILNINLEPELIRRNIVVSHINLLSLKEKKFKIGEAILKTTGICQPCSRMERNLGPGGYNSMRGHGGITATIISSGEIKLNDSVELI